MDTAKITDPSLWAQVGGLNGLVIFMLFLALALFLSAMVKIYQMHREDIKLMMEFSAKEREAWRVLIDTRQHETAQAISAMAKALTELNERSRRFSNHSQKDD